MDKLEPRRLARSPGDPSPLYLKVAFPVGGRGIRNEWMWVQVVYIGETRIEGVLANEPRRRNDLRVGEYVVFAHDEVADYHLIEAGGGYEGNALMRLTERGFGLYAPAVDGTSTPP